MFKSSGWILKDDRQSGQEGGSIKIYPQPVDEIVKDNPHRLNELYYISTVHKFDFSSELQRMSTIVKPSYDDEWIIFVKGSPEMIGKLSLPNSLPNNYEQEYNNHTEKGHRVIAMGYRYLPNFDSSNVEWLNREDFEKDIVFIGLLVMVNELKPQTTQAIKDLKEGKEK